MRPIGAALAAVQLVRSPQARVTVTVTARGQNPPAPAVAWQEVVGNGGQTVFRPTTALGRSDGSLLKFTAASATITRTFIGTPADPAAWANPTVDTLRSHSALAVAALRVPGSVIMRLFYIHLNNNVYYIQSTNDGSTWGSPVTVYGGGDAVGDLVVAYVADGVVVDGPWCVGFSSYDGGTGLYRPRFGLVSGGVWSFTAYTAGWRAAGIDAYGPPTTALRGLLFRQDGQGPSRLRLVHLLNGVYGDVTELDQTQGGPFGVLLSFYRFCQLPEAGCMLGVAGEAAEGRGSFVGVAGLFYRSDAATHSATDDRLVDESIMLPAIVHPRDQATLSLAAVMTTGGPELYLVGDTLVYRGVAQAASPATLVPMRYRYDDHQMELEFPAACPPIQVGQVLTVTRALAWDGQSGSAEVAVWVVRVERGVTCVRVLAVDGFGYLGIVRGRRPAILNDGSATGVAQVMRRLAARAGLPLAVDDDGLENGAVLPITLQPNESLRGAAYRVASQTDCSLVPSNDGTFGVTLVRPPASDSGHYADTPHVYGVAPSAQPIIDAAEIADYRRLAFSYVLGSYSTDPEDGAALAMAAGPVVPNTRPMSYSLTNMRYNTWQRVEDAAATEAARQKTQPITAQIEASANLALEVMDVVEVTEPRLGWDARRLRVRRIAESWEQGRLTQRLWLGEI